MACRRKTLCAVCRLPIVDGKDEAILCEASCQQWYHRGCASLPPERYKELSSTDEPFHCLTCTCTAVKKEMSALSSTVTKLREELHDALKMRESVAELKNEIHALKESLEDARRQLEEAKQTRPQQPRSYAAATKSDKASGPAKVSTTQRTGTKEKRLASDRANVAQNKSRSNNGKRKVPGARRVWGPFHFCSPNAVLGCIKRLTGTDAKLRIKKKTKEVANNKTIWWFVIHGDEKDLCILNEEWSKVNLQTSWRLESCFAPLSNNSETTRDPSNSPANPVECDAPNHSTSTAGKVATTTNNNVSISPTLAPPTTVSTPTDLSQPTINQLNRPEQNDSMSEITINHNDSAENESSHA